MELETEIERVRTNLNKNKSLLSKKENEYFELENSYNDVSFNIYHNFYVEYLLVIFSFKLTIKSTVLIKRFIKLILLII